MSTAQSGTVPFVPNTKELTARYYELCDIRDKTNKYLEPAEKQLTEVNEEIEKLKAKQSELVAFIDKELGGEKWLALKKEIANIARFLVRIPPREV